MTMESLPIVQGAEFWIMFECRDSNEDLTDLSGYTAASELRRYEDTGSELLATFEVGVRDDMGVIGPLDDSGQIWLHLTSEETALIAHNGYGDIKLVDPSGEVQGFIEFTSTIDPAVTN